MNKRIKQAKKVEEKYGKVDSKTSTKPKTKVRVTPYKVSKNSVGIKVKWTF